MCMYQWILSEYMYAKQKKCHPLCQMYGIALRFNVTYSILTSGSKVLTNCMLIFTHQFQNYCFVFYLYYAYLFQFISWHRVMTYFSQENSTSLFMWTISGDDQYEESKQQSWMWHVRDQLHQEYSFANLRLLGTMKNMIFFHVVHMWLSTSFRYDGIYPVRSDIW